MQLNIQNHTKMYGHGIKHCVKMTSVKHPTGTTEMPIEVKKEKVLVLKQIERDDKGLGTIDVNKMSDCKDLDDVENVQLPFALKGAKLSDAENIFHGDYHSHTKK